MSNVTEGGSAALAFANARDAWLVSPNSQSVALSVEACFRLETIVGRLSFKLILYLELHFPYFGIWVGLGARNGGRRFVVIAPCSQRVQQAFAVFGFVGKERYSMAEVPSGSGERLIHLIRLIASGPDKFSLGEFAERASLPASSVHRLLKILERSGFVERGAGQSYHPGRELQRIASLIVSRFDIARFARPLLAELVDRFQETAVLCIYSPVMRQGVIAEVLTTPHPLRFNVEKGVEISLPWGSLGHAILAYLPSSEIEMVLRSENNGPLTGTPRPTRESLEFKFASIRKNGCALYCEDRHDLAGVAAPVFNGKQDVLGSMGVLMPSSRYGVHKNGKLAGAVRDAARELSAQANSWS